VVATVVAENTRLLSALAGLAPSVASAAEDGSPLAQGCSEIDELEVSCSRRCGGDVRAPDCRRAAGMRPQARGMCVVRE